MNIVRINYSRSLATLLVAAALTLSACSPQKTTSSTGEEAAVANPLKISDSYAFSPMSADFGEAKQGDSIAAKAFVLTNQSSGSKTVTASLNANCMNFVSISGSSSCTLASGKSCTIYLSANTAALGELNGCKLLAGNTSASVYLKVSQSGIGSGSQRLVFNANVGPVYSSAAIRDVSVSLETESGALVDTASGGVKIDAISGSAECSAQTAALASSVGGVVNNTGTMVNGLASFGKTAYSLAGTSVKNIRLRAKFQSYVACSDSFDVKPFDNTLKNALGSNPKIQWKLSSLNDNQWAYSSNGAKNSESNPIRIYQGAGIPSLNLRAIRSAGSSVEVIPAFREYEFLIVMSVQRKVGTTWTADRDFFFYKSTADFSDGNRFWAMEFGDYDSNGVLQTPSNAYTLKASYPVNSSTGGGSSGASQSSTLPGNNQSIQLSIPAGGGLGGGAVDPQPTESCALYRIVFRALGGSVLDVPTNNDVLYIKSCVSNISSGGGSAVSRGADPASMK